MTYERALRALRSGRLPLFGEALRAMTGLFRAGPGGRSAGLPRISGRREARSQRRPDWRRFFVVPLLLALTLTDLVFTQPAPAVAANAPLSCGTVYSFDQVARGTPAVHNVWAINTTTGAMTSVATTTNATNYNGFAISADGTRAMAVQSGVPVTPWILSLDVTTGITTAYPGATRIAVPHATQGAYASGAINPATGILYYAFLGVDGLTHIMGFNTNTNTAISGEIARVAGTVPVDLAFDAQGRLYILTPTGIARVSGTVPTTGNLLAGPLLSATTFAAAGSGNNGMAFGGDGYIYVAGASSPGVGALWKINPTSGAVVSVVTTTATSGTNTSGDLASCAAPYTMSLQKNLPGGRLAATDQFNLAITGGGLASGNTGLTAGAETGVQNQSAAEIAGPVLGLPGASYTITETASGTTNLSRYATTWQCVNAAQGNAVLASGTGTTGTFVMPASPAGTGATIQCTFTNALPQPALSVVKTASGTVSKAGDQVLYSFLVTNTGNVSLTGVGVTEGAFTGSGSLPSPSCPGTVLAAGAQMTCTTTYTLTQADVNAGSVANTATATGMDPGGSPVTSPESSASVTAAPAPGISLVKSASPSDQASFTVGQVITYSFLLTNTGNVSLTGVGVIEGAFTGSGSLSAPSCPGTVLAPGAQMTCTASYTLTQADVDAGTVRNTATATGTTPGGSPVTSPESQVDLPAAQNPALSVVKTASGTLSNAGDQVSYSFLVTNTGNVTLSNVGVTDVFTQGGTGTMSTITCQPPSCSGTSTTLVPNQSATFTASYVTTEEDITGGTLKNTATATGTPPAGPNVTAQSEATVVATAWTISKSAATDGSSFDDAQSLENGMTINPGTTITYTVTAASTRGQIDNVVLKDDLTDVLDDASFVTSSAVLTIGTGSPTAVADPAAPSTFLTSPSFSLADGQTATLVYKVVVNASAWGAELINAVTGTGSIAPVRCAPDTTPLAQECTTTHHTSAKVLIEKTGESSAGTWVPMAGSTWAVYSDNAGTPGTVISSPSVAPVPGETGRFQLEGIQPGTYWLAETTAPDGFSLLAEAVQFTIAGNGAVTLGQGQGGGVVTTDDSDGDGIFLITVRDVPALKLPESGGIGWWPFAAGGSLLLLAAAAMTVGNRRRNPAASN